jgi:hypothetical protein
MQEAYNLDSDTVTQYSLYIKGLLYLDGVKMY